MQNLKPGVMDRLGFSSERLKASFSDILYDQRLRRDGPYSGRKAYDLLMRAESGLASITGGPETPPRVGLSIVDIATGAAAHAAVLEALIARSRNGRGADIRISMFDVMADWLSELERRYHNAADDRCPPTPLQRTLPPIGHVSAKFRRAPPRSYFCRLLRCLSTQLFGGPIRQRKAALQ